MLIIIIIIIWTFLNFAKSDQDLKDAGRAVVLDGSIT